MAVLTRSGLQGKLLYKDVNGLRWFNKGIERIQVILKNGGKYFASVDVFNAKARVIPVDGADGGVSFKVNVKVTARVNTIIKQEKEEVLRKMLEKQIKSEIRRTYQVAISQHIDPYRFSETLLSAQ
ncbi:Ger(x)C family spore germination C-terminal domain-containing protein [Terrilactibacillus sp. S3-3]|nr:Ger(x)C family spore germination C-terminal domain-containing protein [Terrilactibacillus sp. S3-3]